MSALADYEFAWNKVIASIQDYAGANVKDKEVLREIIPFLAILARCWNKLTYNERASTYGSDQLASSQLVIDAYNRDGGLIIDAGLWTRYTYGAEIDPSITPPSNTLAAIANANAVKSGASIAPPIDTKLALAARSNTLAAMANANAVKSGSFLAPKNDTKMALTARSNIAANANVMKKSFTAQQQIILPPAAAKTQVPVRFIQAPAQTITSTNFQDAAYYPEEGTIDIKKVLRNHEISSATLATFIEALPGAVQIHLVRDAGDLVPVVVTRCPPGTYPDNLSVYKRIVYDLAYTMFIIHKAYKLETPAPVTLADNFIFHFPENADASLFNWIETLNWTEWLPPSLAGEQLVLQFQNCEYKGYPTATRIYEFEALDNDSDRINVPLNSLDQVKSCIYRLPNKTREHEFGIHPDLFVAMCGEKAAIVVNMLIIAYMTIKKGASRDFLYTAFGMKAPAVIAPAATAVAQSSGAPRWRPNMASAPLSASAPAYQYTTGDRQEVGVSLFD